MQLKRANLEAGTLFYNTSLCTSLVNHIVFSKENQLAFDILSKEIYPINPKKKKGFMINGYSISLDTILKQCGYPEILTENDVKKMSSEDIEKIFLQNGILDHLERSIGEEFNPYIYQNNPSFIKRQFERRQ